MSKEPKAEKHGKSNEKTFNKKKETSTTAKTQNISAEEKPNTLPKESFSETEGGNNSPYSHSHGGHRERLRERYAKNGFESFAPHEVLELLLYQSIPYRDVNQLAHTMLERFGSLKNVFAASPQQLMEFDGIDKSTAYNISLISSLYRYINTRRLPQQKMTTIDDVLDYAYYLIGNSRFEELYIVCLDANGFVVGRRSFEDKIRSSLLISVQKLAETAVYFGAKQVFVVHSHPTGTHEPSLSDIQFTKKLFETLRSLGIILVDHAIVGQGGTYSFYLSGEITKLSQAR